MHHENLHKTKSCQQLCGYSMICAECQRHHVNVLIFSRCNVHSVKCVCMLPVANYYWAQMLDDKEVTSF